MVSFLNGLSQAGTGLAEFAGRAGLEQQRSELASQQLQLANDLATTRETTLQAQRQSGAESLQASSQVYQSGEKALDRSADLARTQLTEGGADRRNAATNATSVKTHEMTIQADADKFSKTLAAGNEITVDANTGNAISVNKASGKVTPITDSEGNPVRLPDTEASKGLTTLLNQTNEELRSTNQQRAQDIRAAQQDLDDASKRPDLFAEEKDKEIAKRRQALADVQKRYDIAIGSLQSRLAATGARLLNLRPGQNAGAAQGDRPALDSILTTPNAAPTRATSSGLLNGGGQ